MPIYVGIPLLLLTMGLGWVAGMWTKRRTNRWCAECGTVLTCRDCSSAGAHQLEAGAGSLSRRLFAVDGGA